MSDKAARKSEDSRGVLLTSLAEARTNPQQSKDKEQCPLSSRSRTDRKRQFVTESTEPATFRARAKQEDPQLLAVKLKESSERKDSEIIEIHRKKNFRRFKGEKLEGFVDHTVNQANDCAVTAFKHRIASYRSLVDRRLPKVGLQDEEDMLRYLCDGHLIDRIPDDYAGYMTKVKHKLSAINRRKVVSEHLSIKGAMAKLAFNIRSFISQRRQENAYLRNTRSDPDYADELDKLTLFKKHRRNKDVIAEKFYIYKKIRDWAPDVKTTVSEQIRRDLETISAKIFDYDIYFQKVKLLNDQISQLRVSIQENIKLAAETDLAVKSDLDFSKQILTQYQDDSDQVIQQVEALLQSVNRRFLI